MFALNTKSVINQFAFYLSKEFFKLFKINNEIIQQKRQILMELTGLQNRLMELTVNILLRPYANFS